MSRTSELTDAFSGLHLVPRNDKTVTLKAPLTPTYSEPRTPPPMTHPSPLELDSDPDKAATVFPSHVRATFRRNPTDRTGDLVRLLDDISTVTHSIASYVASTNRAELNASVGSPSTPALDPETATRKLYASLCHDGYLCMILERTREAPLTFSDTALHGGYIVMLTSLDIDPTATDHVECGTIFSIYKRKSQPSLPGRLVDLQQHVGDQVAAGYVLYSSATKLVYTLGAGAFSFVLHPVATQYFLQPNSALLLPHGGNDLHVNYERARQDPRLGSAALAICAQRGGKVFDTGCLIADFSAASMSGSLFVRHDLHLLCEAAPLAFVTEQLGGKATDGKGKRILDMTITDEDVHKKVSFCAGPQEYVDIVETGAKKREAPQQ